MKQIPNKFDNTSGANGQLTAQEYNEHKNELQNAVTGSDQTLTTGFYNEDVNQLSKGIANHATGGAAKFVDDGIANAYEINSANNFQLPDSIREGMEITFYPANNNTGASTLDYNGEGALPLKDSQGLVLTSNKLIAARRTKVYRKGSEWWLVEYAGSGGGGTGITEQALTEFSFRNFVPYFDFSKFNLDFTSSVARPIAFDTAYADRQEGFLVIGKDLNTNKWISVQKTGNSDSVSVRDIIITNPYTGSLRAVAYKEVPSVPNNLPLFVAVGIPDAVNGDTDAPIYTSNGFAWTQRINPLLRELRDIVYSPALDMFCAVGDYDNGTTSMYIVTSTDNGVTWTAQTNFKPTVNLFYPPKCDCIEWSETLGLFVTGGGLTSDLQGTEPFLMTSPDGITWTQRTVPAEVLNHESIQFIKWCNAIGIFVGIAKPNSPAPEGFSVITSPDGITWTTVAENVSGNSKGLISITFSEQHVLLMATEEDTGRLWVSRDATNWLFTQGSALAVANDTPLNDFVSYRESDERFYRLNGDGLLRTLNPQTLFII